MDSNGKIERIVESKIEMQWIMYTEWHVEVVHRIEWHLQSILVRSECTQHLGDCSLSIGKNLISTEYWKKLNSTDTDENL